MSMENVIVLKMKKKGKHNCYYRNENICFVVFGCYITLLAYLRMEYVNDDIDNSMMLVVDTMMLLVNRMIKREEK